MPTYDYECTACNNRFEAFTSVDDRASKPCPKCGKSKSKRLIGAGGGFIFKGSGFYVNDSKPSAAAPTTEKKAEPVKTETKATEPKKKAN